jgi:hypothetical protein
MMSESSIYRVYYDLHQQGYSDLRPWLISAGLIGAGIVAYKFSEKLNELRFIAIRRTQILGYLVVVLVMSGYIVGASLYEYSSFSGALRKGSVDVTEGSVVNYQPQVGLGKGESESFCVKQKCFSFSTYTSNNQFHQTKFNRSPIREGLPVRVTSKDGAIVRLEILDE